MTQKITPFLWFEEKAEEALEFYTAIFDDARVISVSRHPEGGPAPAGALLTATLELAGHEFMILNGGPHEKFNEAVSFLINCQTQEEVDRYWDALTADGGQPGPCGWLKDKFGVSWQVVPEVLPRLLTDPDADKARRATEAMMKMSKLDIAALTAAHNGDA